MPVSPESAPHFHLLVSSTGALKQQPWFGKARGWGGLSSPVEWGSLWDQLWVPHKGPALVPCGFLRRAPGFGRFSCKIRIVEREAQDSWGDDVPMEKRALSWVAWARGPNVLQNAATHHLCTIPSPQSCAGFD